jgi:tetratricopeptide (TPR) repeat protein
VGKWESDTVIADELGKRGFNVERVAIALTHDQDILGKQLLSEIRKEIVDEFGTVPLTDAGIQSAIDACHGSKEEAVAALRNGVVRAAEEQLRRTRTVQLRDQVAEAWNLVKDVLQDGNEKLFAKELTLEAAATLREEHLAKGRELSALHVSEYSLFRQLQECSAVLASEWSSAETVNSTLLCGGIAAIVGLYNRQAAVYCNSDRYDVAAALLRKADFITSQPSLMPDAWEERLKLRAVTLNNIGAMYKRRGQNGFAMNSFDRATLLWQAADFSSAPKWPLFLPTEHPLSLYLNSASLLLVQGQSLAAKAQAGAAVQAMLEKCLAPSPGLDARAADLSKEADKALAELSDWEDDHADTENERYTQKMEDEHLKVEERAMEAMRKKLISAEDARKQCWRTYDTNADATPDFTRVLATAHYLFAASANALAEEAAQAALEASSAVTDVSAPDASSASDVISIRPSSGAGSQVSASGSEESIEREPGKPWPKRTIVFPEPPSDSELATLHQSRAVGLFKRALGASHPVVELVADALDAQTASEVTGVMYLQV